MNLTLLVGELEITDMEGLLLTPEKDWDDASKKL